MPKDSRNPKDSEQEHLRPIPASLNPSGTLNVPIAVRRNWGVEGKQVFVYFVGDRQDVFVVLEQDLGRFMRRRR